MAQEATFQKKKDLNAGRLFGIDVLSAFGAAAPCAAFVCIIDQAVTQNASKTATIRQSLSRSAKSMFTQPHQFFGGKAYLAVAVVYLGTYIAANSTTTYCERTNRDPKTYKLAVTSAVNIGLGVTKDSLFAIWFGGKAAASIPARAWAMFIMRDVVTIGAGFVLPEIVSDAMVKNGYLNDKGTADIVAQLAVPMSAQLVLTPMHLLALDFYNRPGVTMPERGRYIRSLLVESAAVRMARVGCVYGIAGIGNKAIRGSLLDDEYVKFKK